MKNRVAPFLLGIVVGFWGVRLVTHTIYIALVVASFFIGRHGF